MKVYINDCSLIGQANNIHQAIAIATELAQTFSLSKEFSCSKKGAISPELKNKPIMGNISLIDFLNTLDRKITEQREARELIIQIFCTKPHYKNKHDDLNFITDTNGNCLKGTCFDSAAISKCGALIVSAKNPIYSQHDIEVVSSISGRRKLMNISTTQEAHKIRWVYEPNIKHSKKPKNIGKHTISAMDLDLIDAQKALTNGVYIKSKVISYYKQSWYCFPKHRLSYFHGYKVDFQQNNSFHTSVKNILSKVNYEQRGQIFEGYC